MRTWITGLSCTLLLTLALAAPSAAHDVLIGSVPDDGDALDAAPELIELEYNNEPMDASPAIAVLDEAGETVHEAVPDIEGRFARTEFPELPDGQYTISWSVVSSDGHRLEGAIPFTLEQGDVEQPDDGDQGTETDDPGTDDGNSNDIPETDETVLNTEARPDTEQPTALPGETQNLSPAMTAIVIVAGIGVFGAVAVLAVRRMRAAREDDK